MRLIWSEAVLGILHFPGYFSEFSLVCAELDESDGTIDFHSPEATVALNCDWDHMDRYKKSDDLIR